MKSIFALFIVFSLLLVLELSCARKDLGDYRKNMMNDQPMPEAIKDLIPVPQASSDAGKDHYIRDFNTKSNNITDYHPHTQTHVVPKKPEQKAFDHEQKYEPVLSMNRMLWFSKLPKGVEAFRKND